MSHKKIRNYLRTIRLASGLSQSEVGALAGLTKAAISKYELEQRSPCAKLLVAAPIIFGMEAGELFPGFYDAVEERLGLRAHALRERLIKLNTKRAAKVCGLIEKIPSRMSETRVV